MTVQSNAISTFLAGLVPKATGLTQHANVHGHVLISAEDAGLEFAVVR